MKRLSFLLFFGSVWSLLSAQSPGTGIVPVKKKDLACYNDGYQSTSPSTVTFESSLASRPATGVGSSRLVTGIPLGTAGNLYTILDGQVNRVASNEALNTVVFIHRADPTVFPSANIGQFQYDMSIDGGGTWDLNNGILNPTGDNIAVAGRYPNAAIYNPIGNTQPSNAYMAYAGAWLPYSNGNADWDGMFTGVARLDNNPATFTENILAPNNNNVTIVKGLCNGLPGIFWSIDFASAGTEVDSILLYRGVWSPAQKDVNWSTYKVFKPNFDLNFDGTPQVTSVNVSFDPTGQYGWIVATGDIEPGNTERVFNPFFYRTVDGGVTWTGPEVVNLATLSNIVAGLIDPMTDVPSTAFDIDLGVDVFGNPHAAVVIGSGGADYAISTGGAAKLKIYDITYNAARCGWEAIMLDSLLTFRGQITTDVSEDNRPQVSVSPNGEVVIIGWLESDPTFTNGENTLPNLLTRAINVTSGTATPVVNHTLGDPDFDGQALFASFAPTALINGNNIEVPTVFAQLNQTTLSDQDPANFFYIQGVRHNTSDFTTDVQGPTISLNGSANVTIVSGSGYTDAGATATDNVDGTVTGSIITTGTVNSNVPGTYPITYNVSDATGNAACSKSRTVVVTAAPDNTAPVITLVGNDTITADICGFLVDPGATATDAVSGNLTSSIIRTGVPSFGPGNPGIAGPYTITYSVTDGAGNTATATKTLILADGAPVIELVGANPDTIEACDVFNDRSANAVDACMGPLSVTVTGTVNPQSPGTYTLTYSATDGTTPVSVTRTVVVTADNTAPVLTQTGSNPTYVYLGESYVDQLPTANDCSGILSITSNEATTVNETTRGSYTVTYTATDSNNNSGTLARTVIVNTEPDADFTYVISLVNPLQVVFTDASLYDPTLWLWEFPDGGQNSQRTVTKLFTQTGSYEVCLTARNVYNAAPFNKAASKECKTILLTGVSDFALENAINIYPNPTTGIVNLDINTAGVEQLDVTVFNVLGEAVKSFNTRNVAASSKFTLDLSTFAKGIYMVRVQTESGVVTKKINLHSGN